MKLYVCWGTFQTIRPGGHPCHTAHKALRDAGYEPEVIRVHGLGIGPIKWMTEGRRGVKELTGQPVVPVLITDDGEAINESKRIAEWAQAHPAGRQGPAGCDRINPDAGPGGGIRRVGANRHLIVCLSSQTSREMCKVPRLR